GLNSGAEDDHGWESDEDNPAFKEPGKDDALNGGESTSEADHIQGWKDAVNAGKAPTKAQAEAIEKLDDDNKMTHFIEAKYAQLNEDHDDDDEFNAAYDEASDKVNDLHQAALGTHESFDTPQEAEDFHSASGDSPKEGDTKTENGKTYVLQGGRWHLSGAPEPKPEPSAADFNINKVTYHSHVGNSNKFYSFAQHGSYTEQHWGGIGKKGQKKVQLHDSPSAANAHLKKMMQAKKNKGYYHESGSLLYVPPGADAGADAGAAPKKTVKAAPKKVVASKPSPSDGTTNGWKKVGAQAGSNKGGFYEDHSGTKHYVKTPKSEDHVKNEVLAAKLYQLAGIHVPEVSAVNHDGKSSVASKVIDGVRTMTPEGLAGLSGTADGFAVDAWLANHDAVGMAHDNLLSDNGKAVHIDVGGALLYRAQGGKKQGFNGSVKELSSLRDASTNPQAASVFGHLTDEQIKQSAQKVVDLSHKDISDLVMTYGPGSIAVKNKLVKTLLDRRNNIAKQLGLKVSFKKTKKPKQPKFDPSRLSKPTSFMSWGDTGEPGPSGIKHINRANHDAAKAIYAAAQSGKPADIHNLKQPVLDKESGDVTGEKPVLQHPSQHVVSYANQMLNEIDTQLNPPKKFRLREGDPIKILHDSFPVIKTIKTHLEKIGKYLSLGNPGSFDTQSLGFPLVTYKNGKISK
ncbi:MAG: WGR domain-containing protein, partial [Gammaproteobacteria bacterium]|nr:WGR domain-containing protein [Gammaproteobacteria bacterium]